MVIVEKKAKREVWVVSFWRRGGGGNWRVQHSIGEEEEKREILKERRVKLI
jgi:hypothetical protein